MQVSDRALHDPALDAESGTVIDAAAVYQRFHAKVPDQSAVPVVVATAVGQHPSGRRPGRPRLPRTDGTAWRSGMS
ncbi:hypothetical protein CQW44_14565 [Streptomyces griseofuscus]|uniref:Uncharacterized protein n=1 Tax=Streptomyces griseofuscus TaxID=146922 RepID=A0A3R8RLJ9_9ACTN|nr:hypothetical protein CQW44_14565 [Streptomyces griseofuscus]